MFSSLKTRLFLGILLLSACREHQPTGLQVGRWRAVLQLPPGELPFNFEVKQDSTGVWMEIMNAVERIKVTDISFRNDSVFIQLPVFESEIRAQISPANMKGLWINYARKKDNLIQFSAQCGVAYRFPAGNERPKSNISGKWEVDFSPGIADSSKAIGEFIQEENHLTGTFLTPTGDYRYLEGTVQNDSFYLSCFDGAHAFLFHGVIQHDSLLAGEFWSGLHHHESWTARRNPHFVLPNPDTLTYLRPGYDKLSFSFPGIDSQIVSLEDKRYRDKVVIVQIMGSWCPNCMDETMFLSDFYKSNQPKGVEIIALAYEKTTDFAKVRKNLKRLQQRFGIQYEILFAGEANKEAAARTLPMLNHIFSYPTTIFIDKKGKARKIHTGYSGPATGKYHEEFKKDFYQFIEELLSE